jgi:hypothetical protein
MGCLENLGRSKLMYRYQKMIFLDHYLSPSRWCNLSEVIELLLWQFNSCYSHISLFLRRFAPLFLKCTDLAFKAACFQDLETKRFQDSKRRWTYHSWMLLKVLWWYHTKNRSRGNLHSEHLYLWGLNGSKRKNNWEVNLCHRSPHPNKSLSFFTFWPSIQLWIVSMV